jgi:hypothetical protein
MKALDIPKSGRCGDLVFYRLRRRQFARRYVVPALRRTPATARARGSLGALSKMWRTLLTQEQRQGWNAAAAKVQSRPLLLISTQHLARFRFDSTALEKPHLRPILKR